MKTNVACVGLVHAKSPLWWLQGTIIQIQARTQLYLWPVILPRSLHGGRKGTVPFTNDPYGGPLLTVSNDLIDKLSGPHFLSTAVIHYLLQ